MLTYPDIDPIALQLGPLKIHWYGITYLVGFVGFWALGVLRAKQPHSPVKPDQIGDMLFYGVLGVILGGRLGYILFYNLPAFIGDPLILFQIWQGGMSFHGGLIGVVIAAALYSRRHDVGFVPLCDFIAPMMPVGLGAGRIGNFINGELWGAPTNLPWGMIFPGAGPEPRHPSQLYEALLEGVLLFVILWLFSRQPRPTGVVCGLFLIGYGVFRSLVEFVRLPDAHIGYLAFGWLTLGQALTLPMIILGLALMAFAYRGQGRRETA
ncbi:MAG: prolipoprotein diacylglyceryl transferase [Gammaproteobacteria bacterium]